MPSDERKLKARVVLIDETGAIFLFRGAEYALREPGPWHFLPGGTVDAGESFEDAARREVQEETGLELEDVGPIVMRHDATFLPGTRGSIAHEVYFVVPTDRFEIATDGWTDREHLYVAGHRWWRRAELRASSHAFYPDGLIDLLDAHVPELPNA